MNYFWRKILLLIALFSGVGLLLYNLIIIYDINKIEILVWLYLLFTTIIFFSIMIVVFFKVSKKNDARINAIYNDTINQLDNIDDFFYESKLDLEKKRKAVIYYLIIMIAIFIGICIFSFTLKKFNYLTLPLSTVMIIIFSFEYHKKRDIYTKYYKEVVINDLLKYINANLKYNPCGDQDDFERFLEAGFAEPEYDFYTVTDKIIKNDIEGTLTLNQIKLKKWRPKSINDIVDFFTFADYKIDQDIKLNICISKNRKFDNKPIDDENFDKYFFLEYNLDINNGNKLIKDINRLIIEYYNRYAIDLNMKIINNRIYIKFYTEDILEPPSVFLKVTNNNTLKTNYSTTKGIIEFCSKLRKIIDEDI